MRSFQSAVGRKFVGLDNYIWFFTSDDALVSLRNNLLWVVLLTVFTVGLGLLIAVLVDRVRYESFAKTIIFLPLAISMVAAGVIWRFMYDYKPPGQPQTGTLNGDPRRVRHRAGRLAAVDTLGLNTFADHRDGLDVDRVRDGHHLGRAQGHQPRAARGRAGRRRDRVAGVPPDRLPAALPTLAVVSTTIIITALKAFDIVYTLTNGNYDTDVIAQPDGQGDVHFGDFGRASAVAVVLLLAIVPIMALNIHQFRAQESVR